MFGDRFNELAVPIIVLAATESAFTAGLVTASNRVPALLFALPVGVLLDRVSRHRLMIIADYARAAVLLPLVVALAIGAVPVALLTAVMFVVGIGDLVFLTAARAFMVSLVDRSRLVDANGKLEVGDAIATLSGPAIGALVLQVFGAATAIAVNAVSFVASAALLGRIPRHASPFPSARPDRLDRIEELLGRVGAASFLLTTAAATLGAVVTGALIGGIGHRETLVATGTVFVVAGAGLWRLRLAHVPLQALAPIDAA